MTVRDAIPLVGSIVEELKSRGDGGRVGGGREEELIRGEERGLELGDGDESLE